MMGNRLMVSTKVENIKDLGYISLSNYINMYNKVHMCYVPT